MKKLLRRLERSKNRVLPKIKRLVEYEGLTMREPVIAGILENKSSRNLGKCVNKKYIYIRKEVVEIFDKEDLDKVMIHEIMHCVLETKSHCKLFKSLMRSMDDIMGYQITHKGKQGIKGGIINVSYSKYQNKEN